MSTKRKVIDRSKSPGGGGPFTPEILAVFKQLLEFERDPARRIREDDGGTQPEYRKVCDRLNVLLGFDEPWTRYSPAYVHGDSLPPKRIREHERADWERTIKVRRELEQAAAESR
jgi:hypothetical protein